MRISRTVQWMREAARVRDAYLHRALAETVLTGIYLATFVYWMGDGSPSSTSTRQFLDALLRGAERWALPSFVPATAAPPREPSDSPTPIAKCEATR
jgi:hypothetical protein